MFGDLEPDTLSLDPRNRRVWEVAAPKVAAGTLRAIFIECSYDDSVDDGSLYGHLCPRHLISELAVLAVKVEDIQQRTSGKRRREDSQHIDRLDDMSPKPKRSQSTPFGKEQTEDVSPTRVSMRRGRLDSREHIFGTRTVSQSDASPIDVDGDIFARANNQRHDPNSFPLVGIDVYIIHIKDNLADGPPPGDQILQELNTQGEYAKLGCKFHIPEPGEGIWI